MSNITDDYNHDPDSQIEYCLESILYEPDEQDAEFSNLRDSYNSTLLNGCCCISACAEDECSHSNNYKIHDGELLLSDMRLSKDIIYECSSRCACNAACGNRLVQLGPRKNLKILPSPNVANQEGLFTMAPIPRGAFVCEYAGEILTRSEALRRSEKLEALKAQQNSTLPTNDVLKNYIICLKERSSDLKDADALETFIDPTKVGNIGRYLNHSCDPNCEIISVRIDCPIPKLAIFSKRQIEKNEELYFHYGGEMRSSKTSENPVPCLCDSENCQKFLPELNY